MPTKFVFCSETPDELLEDCECSLIAGNGINYEFMIGVDEDCLSLYDSIGRFVPIDITQIDQVIDALVTARGLMLTPNLPDTYVDA